MKIESKLVLITGGSRGLGRDMAMQLGQNGADVVITYRERKDDAHKVVAEVEGMGRRAACLQLDSSRTGSFAEFSKQLGDVLSGSFGRSQFDFLVNNAGISGHTLLGNTTEEAFDNLLNVHFKGVYFLTQALSQQIADGGGIILLSSGLARFALPGASVYGSLKGAIDVLARYWAKELGGRRIRVNSVAPGAIATDFNADRFNANPEIPKFIAAQTALGRVGQADDIGGIVAFLCSEEGRWINGQRIEASGGMFL